MNVPGIAALLLAWAIGGLVVVALWPRARNLRDDTAIILPLSALIGLATTSWTFFAASLVASRPAILSGMIDLGVAGMLMWRVRSRWGEPRSENAAPDKSFWEWILALLFICAAVVAAVVTWRAYRTEPLGGWDGWAIWNMHARFMLRAGTSWPELAAASQLHWTHPDYPRLIPASVARVWSWIGSEPPAAPAAVSVIFSAALTSLLVGVVRFRRGFGPAFTAGLLLLATPFFITFSSNQHADIPLGTLIFAAVALAIMPGATSHSPGWWALSGICAGAAAWTKNEGLLFVVIFAPVASLFLIRRREWNALSGFAAALIGSLIPLIYFKLSIAPTNDLMASAKLAQLFDLSRHKLIAAALWRDFGTFGEWYWAPWLVLGATLFTWRARNAPRDTDGVGLVFVTLVLLLGGYYSVYLITSHHLAPHLDTSLVRLLLQLWPLTILAWSLVVPNPIAAEAFGSFRIKPKSCRKIFWPVNVSAVIAIVAALSLQRGAGELAVARSGFATATAFLGDGWHAAEKHGADEWAWTAGPAKIGLHVADADSFRRLTLRFALRGAAGQNVTVRRARQILWEGKVAEQFVPVTIVDLQLSRGTTFLEFSTDNPGVVEAPAAGGRTLAFAVYNFRMD